MYSMLQLAFISSKNSMLSGSVIQPPSISNNHLSFYNNVASVLYISVLLSAIPAIYALKKVKFKDN